MNRLATLAFGVLVGHPESELRETGSRFKLAPKTYGRFATGTLTSGRV